MAPRLVRLARVVLALSVALVVLRVLFGGDPLVTLPDPTETFALAPGSVERFAPLLGDAPDERWAGCWLVGATSDPHHVLLSLRCAPSDAAPITASVGASPEPAGYVVDVQGAGPRAEALRAAVLARTREVYDVSPFHAATQQSYLGWVLAAWVVLTAFLVAWALGAFGPLAPDARDPAMLAPAIVALVVRAFLTLPTNEEIRLHFQSGVLHDVLGDKHSLVGPLVRLLAIALTRVPVEGQIASTIAVGALTTLAIHVFVHRRTGDRRAALFAALLFAVHPALARSGASDAHYPLLLAGWSIALATLAHPSQSARGTFAALVWLGIAAGCRFEAPLYLATTPILLGKDAIVRLGRHRRALAAGLVVIVAIEAAQVVLKLPVWRHDLVDASSRLQPLAALRTALFAPAAGGPVLGVVALLAIALGVASRPHRLVAIALASAWAAVAIVTLATTQSLAPLFAHRVSPEAFVLAMATGTGLAAGVERIRAPYRDLASGLVAATLCGALLVTGTETRTAEHAFNTEYRLALRVRDAPPECALAFFGCESDGSLCNPELVLPRRAVLDCRHDDCASPRACLFYLRTGACYGEGGDEITPRCAALERGLDLAPIEEVDVDLAAAYGGRALPRSARLGLYRADPRDGDTVLPP